MEHPLSSVKKIIFFILISRIRDNTQHEHVPGCWEGVEEVPDEGKHGEGNGDGAYDQPPIHQSMRFLVAVAITDHLYQTDRQDKFNKA